MNPPKRHSALLFGITTGAALMLLACPIGAQDLPAVELWPGGAIGPPQDQPIAAVAVRAGSTLVARSEDDGHGLALYRMVLGRVEPSPAPELSFTPEPSPFSPVANPPSTPPDEATPSPTPEPLPAFGASLVGYEDEVVDGLAMASNGRKVVLGISGHDPEESLVSAEVWMPGLPDAATNGPVRILERGPARPTQLAAAVAPDGTSMLAWSTALPGRPAGLRMRAIQADGRLGPLRLLDPPGVNLSRPAIAAGPGGFMMAFVRGRADRETSLASPSPSPEPMVWPGATPGNYPRSESVRMDFENTLAAPGFWARHKIAWLPLDDRAAQSGPARATASGGDLDHPQIVSRDGQFDVFWTALRGGGRELRFKAASLRGWQGPERYLRTDLHPDLRRPYAVAGVGRDLWLAIYPQYEEATGSDMVLEGRLYYPEDYAISPPLLLAAASSSISLRGLVPAGHHTWLALWDQVSGDQHQLEFRPLHVRM